MTFSLSHWGPLEALADQSIDIDAFWAWFKSNGKAVQALLDGSAGVVALKVNGASVASVNCDSNGFEAEAVPLERIRLDVRA